MVVDVGSSGRRGDGNVFYRSEFEKKLKNDEIGLPPPCSVQGCKEEIPFYFVGDAAFERGSIIITPFKGKFLPPEKRVFNYRISRGRRQLQNGFAMLYKRYEVYLTPLEAAAPHSKSIVLATCALHNLHLFDEESISPGGRLDRNKVSTTTSPKRIAQEEDLEKEEEIFRRLKKEVSAAKNQKKISGNRLTQEPMDYFVEYDLPWQWESAGISPE